MRSRLRHVGALAVPFLAIMAMVAPGTGADTHDTPPTTTVAVPPATPEPTPSTTVVVPPTTVQPPTSEPGTTTTTVVVPPPEEPPAAGAPSAPPVEQEAEFDPDAELAAARERVRERLVQVGDVQTLIVLLRAEIEAELTELDAQLAVAEADTAAATQAAETAEKEQAAAEASSQAAQEAAEQSRRTARDSVIDAFMSPMTAASAQALGDQNDAAFARGLIESRADHRLELTEAAASAERAADRARRSAEQAAQDAAKAVQAAADASALASETRTARIRELEDLTGVLIALQTETQTLGVFDGVLEQRELTRLLSARVASSQPVDKASTVRIPETTIDVYRLISDQATDMIAAARAEGVPLDGWGWRSTKRQIELRMSHCGTDDYSVYEMPSSSCSPPTARPGNSMHERGVAIDFKDCDSRSTPCYRWLAEHAHEYGFYNLPSEPWHWSTNGR